MVNAIHKENAVVNKKLDPKVLKIVERVLLLEKNNLHLSQPHLINDVVTIIKEEA